MRGVQIIKPYIRTLTEGERESGRGTLTPPLTRGETGPLADGFTGLRDGNMDRRSRSRCR